ncbi:MAG TPA: isoprenyl transferase [Gammaproteobacteria bacterium]|nr:isoprenyl transferase [Gammaproteobacteria bacterium]
MKNLPKHIAIIMDGNGRWATKKFLPRIAGHKAGYEAVKKTIRACIAHKIDVLTLFAFSSENWARPKQEVDALMQLFIYALRHEVKLLHKNNVQLRVIGNVSSFNQELQTEIQKAIALTANNTGLILVVAADYGGHWDIVEATKKIVSKIQSNQLAPEDVTPEIFEKHLSTGDLPLPDLFIRTSGEQRISNFLLWQLAYTELYFTESFWPDFDEKALDDALHYYADRERRFGKVSEHA